jgi:hypothetical protein
MWMLFIIVMQADSYMVAPRGPFPTMEACFEARESTLSTFPDPKINYEAVCVQTNQIKGAL